MEESTHDFRVSAPKAETFAWLRGRAEKSGELLSADEVEGRFSMAWRGDVVPGRLPAVRTNVMVEAGTRGVSLVTVIVDSDFTTAAELVRDFAGPLGDRIIEPDSSRAQTRAFRKAAKLAAASESERTNGVAFGPVRIWPNRLTYGKATYALSSSTLAEVHTSGGIAGVNKHDWAFMAGSRKGKLVDKRSLIVSITDDDWAINVPFHAEFEMAARNLAAKVGLHTRALQEKPSEGTQVMKRADPQGDVLDQLERLGRLRDGGILTEDEFQAKKREILGP